MGGGPLISSTSSGPASTRDSIWTNLLTPYAFDDDAFETNVLLHPYHGGLDFTAARSCGRSFWVSSLYALGSSWAWESMMENHRPSLNDMITTVIAGSMLGEALFRLSRLARGEAPRPSWGRRAGAFLASPVTGLNELLLDGFPGRPRPPSPWSARLAAGLSGGVYAGTGGEGTLSPQPLAGAALRSGLPGEAPFRSPFDLFELEVRLIGLPRDGTWGSTGPPGPAWALSLRGLLLGAGADLGSEADLGGRSEAERSGRACLLGGLFGAFDYGGPSALRASATALGPGLTVVLDPAGALRLEGTLLAAPAFGSGGSRVPLVHHRDYAFAFGLLGIADLRLQLYGRLELRTALHALLYPFPVGGMRGQGGEATLLGSASALVRLGSRPAAVRHALALEADWAARRARYSGVDSRQRVLYYGLVWALELGPSPSGSRGWSAGSLSSSR